MGMLEVVSGGLAGSFDRAVHAFALSRGARARSRSRSESLGPEEREAALELLRERVTRESWLRDPDAFFPRPAPIVVRRTPVRALGRHGEVVDLSWASRYEPLDADVADRYLRHEPNATAHARLLLHRDRPRPVVVLIHGYLGGVHGIEERAWPVSWMFRRGLDVALFVLPFHGLRAPGPWRRPPFPGSDPRVTIEGFRQAVGDLRGLLDWFEARGASSVGVMGMSLGGYTTALAATVEPRLAFAVPFIPLASIADFALEGGRLVGSEAQRQRQHELLEAVYSVVSPLARPVQVAPEGRLVVAGRADRITPMSHAERIARHFEAPLEVFYGGHLLQLGRGRGFRAVGRMLGQLGLLE
jgi:pimeloyl-ACP methyl ester carboxylesterase